MNSLHFHKDTGRLQASYRRDAESLCRKPSDHQSAARQAHGRTLLIMWTGTPMRQLGSTC